MSNLQDIEKLFDLKEKGIITEAEFEEQKAKLLVIASHHISASQAFKDFWRKSFVYQGRANRAEYWWPYLFNMLIGYALTIPSAILSVAMDNKAFELIPYAYSIPAIFPGLAVFIRRFHDLGKSAIFALTPVWIMLAIGLVGFSDVVRAYSGAGFGGDITPTKAAFYAIGVFSLLIVSIVWFVFLCLPGQKSANQYGDPK